MKNKKFWVILLIILVVILAATIYLILKNKKGAVSYVTEDVSRGTVVSSISASGSVVSSNYYSIITQASGVVEVVYVKDGDKVSVGQKLLSISLDQDGQQAQAEAYATYLKAQSSLQSAQDNKLTLQSSLDQTVYTRQKNLDSAKTALKQAALDEKTATSTAQKVIKKAAIVAAQKALDFAQSQYNANTDVTVAQSKLDDADNAISQAQINLQAAKIAYQQTQSIVTSPINGVVSGTSCYVGMSITQSSTSNSSNAKSTSGQLLAISNQSNPVINVSVSESDIAKIKTDQKATITVDALTDKTFAGKVIGINKTGTVSSGVTNYPVTIQFDSQVDNVLPNMSATANIILDTKADVINVSSAALTQNNGQYTVQVLVNNQPQIKNVEVGISSDTMTEIISGLSEGEKVITSTVSSSTTTAKTSSSTSSIFGGIRTGGGSFGSSGNTNVRSGSASRAN